MDSGTSCSRRPRRWHNSNRYDIQSGTFDSRKSVPEHMPHRCCIRFYMFLSCNAHRPSSSGRFCTFLGSCRHSIADSTGNPRSCHKQCEAPCRPHWHCHQDPLDIGTVSCDRSFDSGHWCRRQWDLHMDPRTADPRRTIPAGSPDRTGIQVRSSGPDRALHDRTHCRGGTGVCKLPAGIARWSSSQHRRRIVVDIPTRSKPIHFHSRDSRGIPRGRTDAAHLGCGIGHHTLQTTAASPVVGHRTGGIGTTGIFQTGVYALIVATRL